MHLYLQLTRSLAVTLIWIYCNKLVLRYVRLRVSDLGQVSIPQPGIVTYTKYKYWSSTHLKKKVLKYIKYFHIKYKYKYKYSY